MITIVLWHDNQAKETSVRLTHVIAASVTDCKAIL